MATLIDYFSTSSGWAYFLAPLLLGILHGIEPGHSRLDHPEFESKKETFKRPFILGLAAAVSHTLMIWIIAAIASCLGSHWKPKGIDSYLELASAILTLGLTMRSFFRLQWRPSTEPPAIRRGLAAYIQRHFDQGRHSTPHLVMSGAAIGVMPCPMTLGVLFVCLQSGRLMLGMTLAACFGAGLAVSMATAGSVSSWFTDKAREWQMDVDGLRHRIAFIFCIFLGVISCVIAWRALSRIARI